jgi:SHS2 domain-containing protein
MDKKYIVIDHPSDIGIEAIGKDIKGLFENSAFGMMDMMFELSGVKKEMSFDVKVTGDDQVSLLVSWLSELLYLSDSNHVALSDFKITKMSDAELEAKVYGGKIGKVKRFIKAATYNQLEIKKEKGSWKSRIIFDV